MGNSNSSPINETLSLPSWNLSHLPKLQEHLGSRSSHIYSSYPKQIPEENVFSNLDMRHFSCPDGELLNSFLEKVHSHMQLEFLKENWTENGFPTDTEQFKLLEQEIKNVTLTEEQLTEFRGIFKLPLTIVEEEPAESEETEKKTEGEGAEGAEGEEAGAEESAKETVKKEKQVDIQQVYSGYSVYEFSDNSIGIPLENKVVGLESCFVGSQDKQLVILAPSEEPTLTSKIRLDWHIIQVGNERIKLVLEDARPVLVDEGGKVTDEAEDNHFENLVNAHQSFEDNNSRSMALYGRRYLAWVKKIQEDGQVRALAGGEIEGEIVSLGDFLEKMKLE